MNEPPLFILGKLAAKFERLDDLLADVKVSCGSTWLAIEDCQRSIDADLERLVGIYSNPLQQIQEITEEHRNAYMGFVKELINTAPEKMK